MSRVLRLAWKAVVWAVLAAIFLYVALFAYTLTFFYLVDGAEDCVVNSGTVEAIRNDCWGITGDRKATLDDVPPGYAVFLTDALETEGSTVWEIDFLLLGRGAFHLVVGPDGQILDYVPSYE